MFGHDNNHGGSHAWLNLEAVQQSLRDVQLDMARLNEKVRLQREVIGKLVQFVAAFGGPGEALLQEKEVREFLQLAPQQQGSGRVIGKLRCPSCNSVVDDKEGVLDEKCQWCGAQLSSEK